MIEVLAVARSAEQGERLVGETIENFVLGARKACEAWHAGEYDVARDVIRKLTTYLDAQAKTLDDGGRAQAALAAARHR